MPNLILWRVDFEKRNIFFFLFSFVSFCRKALDRVSNYRIMERKNRSGLRMITIVVYFLKKNRSSRKSFGEIVLLFFFEWINEELMLKRSIDRCLDSRDIYTYARIRVYILCVCIFSLCKWLCNARCKLFVKSIPGFRMRYPMNLKLSDIYV